ncbi:FimV family protein [Sulfurivermis fontis]|uniref:type IV pilus assembly protein FimV n=1 Tax=Sulfurivermis fontis TaxID=1972068 RepID=UPI00155937A6|nr:FimV/HubP family polar landmark protein [Sulfurivermis fontis]
MRSRRGLAGRLARALLCCCLLWGGHAQALGLGSELHVRSALNQPLQAELPLVLAPGETVADVKVGLAGREAYRRIGLPYHEGLPPLSFKIARGASGQPVISISSRQPVREPALELLLEIRWGRSSMLRQYALLLDPPSLYTPPAASAAPAALEAPAPPVTVAAPVPPAPVVASYGPVQRGETLSQIAQRLKPEGVGTPQMTVALFEANPHAFIGGNMNRLRWGTTLYMPSAEAITARSRGSAGKLMLQQRQALQETVPTGPAAAAPVDAAPAPALQILTPPSPGAQAGELERRLAEVRKLNATVTEENEALRQRLGALERQAQRLAEQVLHMPAATPATAEPASPVTASTDAVPAPAAPPAAEPFADGRLTVATTVNAPASRWQNPAWWITVLAGLLLLAAVLLGWLWWRRNRRWEYRDLAQALRDDAEAKARAREAMLEKARQRFR